MNKSILIRTNTNLKKRFETQAKRQGFSIAFLLYGLMETYSEKLEILKAGFNKDMFDTYWTSTDRNESLEKLATTLEKKWF